MGLQSRSAWRRQCKFGHLGPHPRGRPSVRVDRPVVGSEPPDPLRSAIAKLRPTRFRLLHLQARLCPCGCSHKPRRRFALAVRPQTAKQRRETPVCKSPSARLLSLKVHPKGPRMENWHRRPPRGCPDGLPPLGLPVLSPREGQEDFANRRLQRYSPDVRSPASRPRSNRSQKGQIGSIGRSFGNLG